MSKYTARLTKQERKAIKTLRNNKRNKRSTWDSLEYCTNEAVRSDLSAYN